MIEITLTELAFWVLGVSFALIVAWGWTGRWSHAKEEKRALRERVVCRLCLAVFESRAGERVEHCPECGAKTDNRGPTPLG